MTTLSNLWFTVIRPVQAVFRTFVFFLKVFPMLPSRVIDWVTKEPVIEKVTYHSRTGTVVGEIYRPPGGGPHPAMVVCLGVVPFGFEHPQVPVLGRALARSGFAGLLYWSPTMRDFRLEPEDVENIALAYDWLIQQPYIDADRSGLLGTCVGGSFAIMASATTLIRERVAFVSAYAPYSSMWTFARDIASASVKHGEIRDPWKVDQLTRKVFVQSLTAWLQPAEGDRLHGIATDSPAALEVTELSEEGQAVYKLLAQPDPDAAETALQCLPEVIQEKLTALSPTTYIEDLHAPLFIHLHDVGDQVIPVGESRRLQAALKNRPGVHYTEMNFSHLDPVKGKLPVLKLMREFWKLFRALFPIFWQASGRRGKR
jgi:dienelactone hydrolase